MLRSKFSPLPMPKYSLHLAAYNVRTLNQIGQHTALARIIETFKIDVYCVSETHMEDPIIVITLRF